MAFFRKLFRGNEGEASPPAPDADAPTKAGAPAADPPAPDAGGAVTVPDAAVWWDSSAPAAAEAPPARQSSAESAETPTAPVSVLEVEKARQRLASVAAQVAAATGPEPVSLNTEPVDATHQLEANDAPALSSRQSAQGLAAMAARDIGRVREINQDSVFAMITTLPREGSDLSVGLFIVADGMGGHQGGEVASRLAIRTVVHQVLSELVLPALDDSMSAALQPLMISAVQAANQAIWDTAQAMGSDMGTTCTAALLVGHGLYIAHVGDSRAYLYEPGGLRQITTDHSTVGRLIQLGQLEPSEAREHPLRNQLYRTVGQQAQVMVDFIYQPLGVGSHLLLCSDGLWGMVDDPALAQALTRSPWPQDACNELIALANLAGGEDNISAVVVSLPMAER
ncbi:protein phosphatase 2C domain-containing protein [Oscillochloris sp. ZM17-4]|uniref:PP2C family protein-serine/threonine phosphatase n=1 Tax=Oscillochloris sp. ZM17-4 TaxID=2866714 RepID=UPI001C731ACB|nr:PP2C family serine/threonine-protein phosphatase [Oscillochloris sp. ZM17-4]MBX0328624.1 protein phosphatase 2C domain-containing protein [Oscillochloris sp. ZM17-4]